MADFDDVMFDLGFGDNASEEVGASLQEAAETVSDLARKVDLTIESAVTSGRKLESDFREQVQGNISKLRGAAEPDVRGMVEFAGEDFRRDEPSDRSPPPEPPTVPTRPTCDDATAASIASVRTELVPGSTACFVTLELATSVGFVMATMYGADGSVIGNQILDPFATSHSFTSSPYNFDGADRVILCEFYCSPPTSTIPALWGSDSILAPDCQESPQPPEEPTTPLPPVVPEPPETCNTCNLNPCACPRQEHEIKWQVYRRGRPPFGCYVIRDDEDPQDPIDTFQTETNTQAGAQRWADENCGDDDDDDGGESGSGTRPKLPPGLAAPCSLDEHIAAYRSGKSDEQLAKYFRELAESFKAGIVEPSEATPYPWVYQIIGDILAAVADGTVGAAAGALETLSKLASAYCDDAPGLADTKLSQLFIGIAEQWLGADMNPWTTRLRYKANAQCPFGLPTSAEAAQGWLNGSLGKEQLEELLKANGNCPEEFLPIIEANRTKLAAGMLADAWRRGYISEDRLESELRASGFTEELDAETLKRMTEFIPGPSDLIRFLVRDVEDPGIVDRFGLDDDFGSKFQGLLKDFADQQGVSDETMKRYWRAHWDIPSPTQLYEMFHRLRFSPDENLRVDEETVKTALQQQDILPFWIDRFLAVSFNPLTRVDTRRGYDIGSLDAEQVADSYRAQGYDETNVEILVDFSTRIKYEGVDNQKPVQWYKDGLATRDEARSALVDRGFPEDVIFASMRRVEEQRERTAHSLRPYRLYLDGLLTEEEFREDLVGYRFPPESIDRIVGRANRELDKVSRQKCIDALRTRFFWGELDKDELRNGLIGLGLPGRFADEWADRIACEAVSAEKQGTLREFYRWLEYGVSTPGEILDRLRKLRYDKGAAETIVAGMMERLRLAEEKERRQAEAKQKRLLQQEQRRRRRTAKEAQRLLERGRKAAADAKRAVEKRALTLEKAATKYADKFNTDLAITQDRVQGLASFVRRTTDLNADSQVEAAVRAVDHSVKTDTPDLEGIIAQVSESIEDWLDMSE